MQACNAAGATPLHLAAAGDCVCIYIRISNTYYIQIQLYIQLYIYIYRYIYV